LAATYINESGEFDKVAFTFDELKEGVFMQKEFLGHLVCISEQGVKCTQPMVYVEAANSGSYQISTELSSRT